MKRIMLVLMSLLVVGPVYSQEILKSIENKKTKESITAFCDEYQQDVCTQITLKHINPMNKTERTLFTLSEKDVLEGDVKVQEVIHGMESHQMMKNKYKVLATYKKVCEMSPRDTNYISCAFKTLIAGGLFVAGGIAPAAAAFSFGTATGSLALGGAVFSMGMGATSFLQNFLYYPALATDVVRLVTVYPVKKLINVFQTRSLKRKIIPVLEELSRELEDPAKLSELQSEKLYEHDDDRIIVLKNSQFKRILKFFSNGK